MKEITDKNFKSNNSEFIRNKEKQQQIDEIAECVLGGTIDYRLEVAELIYNKGYRRQSEVAREIFSELDEALAYCLESHPFAIARYNEIKKKYIGA